MAARKNTAAPNAASSLGPRRVWWNRMWFSECCLRACAASMPLYGVSMVSFGLLIFEATARPRWCAALASSNGAAMEEPPSRVASSCMVFTVSLSLELVCLGVWCAFVSSQSLPLLPRRAVFSTRACHRCICADRATASAFELLVEFI
jgi:hypothetical protein